MMRQIRTKMLCAILLAGICGCSREAPDGLWDPIRLDKSELSFAAAGGEATVSALNYGSWWINGGHEGALGYDPETGWQLKNYVYSTSTGTYTYDLLEGEWYHAVVPNQSRSNRLVVTVDANDTGASRMAIIEMEAGDAFTSVKIKQLAE